MQPENPINEELKHPFIYPKNDGQKRKIINAKSLKLDSNKGNIKDSIIIDTIKDLLNIDFMNASSLNISKMKGEIFEAAIKEAKRREENPNNPNFQIKEIEFKIHFLADVILKSMDYH